MNPYARLLVGWSVFHNFLKGRKVTLPGSYRSTYFRCKVSLMN